MSYRLLRFEADVNANVGDVVEDGDLTVVSEPEPEPLSTPGYVENYRVTAGGASVINTDSNTRSLDIELGLSITSATEQQFIGTRYSDDLGSDPLELVSGGRNSYDDYIYPHESLKFIWSLNENQVEAIEWETIPDEKLEIDIPVRTV